MPTPSTSFNFHPTRNLTLRITSLARVRDGSFCLELSEGGHHFRIFFASGEALTEFSENLQEGVLDARMAQEGALT